MLKIKIEVEKEGQGIVYAIEVGGIPDENLLIEGREITAFDVTNELEAFLLTNGFGETKHDSSVVPANRCDRTIDLGPVNEPNR